MTADPGIPSSADEPDGDDLPVGMILRRMRTARRLSGRALADRVGLSQSSISRLERGIGSPDLDEIRKVARALGADDHQVQDLIRQAQRSHDRMTDWRPTLDSLAGRQKSVADRESEARVIHDFQPAVLPGLLQISPYAKAVLRLFQPLIRLPVEAVAEAAVLAAVSARVQRQLVLADRSKSFSFVITEAVLKDPPCTPAEMLAQIGHLREVATDYGNVSLAVIPDGAPMAIPALHGFTLFDEEAVVVDIYHTGLLSRGRRDVEIYHQVFRMNLDRAGPIEPLLDKYQAFYIDALAGTRDR